MAKVEIMCLVSGKKKTMEKRYADVLVKMKRAYYVEKEPYKTKVMVAEKPVSYETKVVVPDIVKEEFEETVLPAEIDEEGESLPEVEIIEQEPVKRRGRPKKIKTEE